MALAADAGHRVVLVVATRGEHGEVAEGFLADGETLADRRVRETHAAAEALGAHRVEFLGYVDSGMVDTPENSLPGSFWSADVDEAAERLAAILREEDAEVLTVYDWHGNYGHPDHVKVHEVGHRAGKRAGTPHVYEATMNRDEIKRQMATAREAGEEFGPDADFDPDGPMDDGNPMGMTEDELTLVVDVSDFVRSKHAAISSHASQVTDAGFFTGMSDEAFAFAFGREWFIEHGREPGLRPGWLFEDV